MGILFLIYTIPVMMLLSVLIYQPWRKNYVSVKTVASIAFLLLALWCGMQGTNQTLMRLELPAFVLCLCGDVFLGFYNGSRKKKYFIRIFRIFRFPPLRVTQESLFSAGYSRDGR